MGRLAVVAGHSVLGTDLAPGLGFAARVRAVPVPGGPVVVADGDAVVFLQRHGAGRYVPAWRIDHHAHAAALARLGCDRVLAISSVGALRPGIGVGTVIVPDEVVSLAAQPESRFVDERSHGIPGFDATWRARVVESWAAHAATPPVDGGVYWQVTGPRFETTAEVRFLATFADVVGMTVGSECIAAGEQGLAYAAVCVVDNLANGVGDRLLTSAEFEAGKDANRAMVLATLRRVLEDLGR